jgi:hypothetical protein
MLAVDNPETSRGEAFNGTEDTMPTTVQWVLMVRFELYFQRYFSSIFRLKMELFEQVAEAMGKEIEVVEMPNEIAAPFRPLNQGENDGIRGPHIHFNEKAHRLLGYKDVVVGQLSLLFWGHFG